MASPIRNTMEAVRSKMSKLSTAPQRKLSNPQPQDRLESMGYERGEELGRGSFGYALKVRRRQDGRTYGETKCPRRPPPIPPSRRA